MLSITITFGTGDRTNDDITGGWIADQIHSRERADEPVCAQVHITGPGLDLRLAAGHCGAGGSGRPLSPAEREVVDLWIKRHLDGTDFSPGALEGFARQVRRL